MHILESLFQEEERVLAPYACHAQNSCGRKIEEADDPMRTCFMRDRDRIIHSKAFRRLKHKTQVYISPGSDHYRTRLTHTLEVSQIARTIGRALKLNGDLIEAIALAHDVGHTPFAHCGEEVLAEKMISGFEHNHNSVRVLDKIERRQSGQPLNLSWEVLNGVFHHSGFTSSDAHAATIEGQVIRFADKIAYVQHDIDDSIRAGLLTEDNLPVAFTNILGHSLSERLTTLINDLVHTNLPLLQDVNDPSSFELSFSPSIHEALTGLRRFLFQEIYHGDVCSLERERASFIVHFLYDYYYQHAEKMPVFFQEIVKVDGLEQGVADYISGMTDNYCIERFKELTIPRSFIH